MDIEKIFKHFQEKDTLARHLGIELLEVTPGGAKAKMAIQPFHFNGYGTVHGGAIFSLADFTFAAACNSHGTVAVAINVTISYFKASTEGILFAEAHEAAVNPKLGTYLITITNEKGEAIALFQGTAYRKKEAVLG